ncbi:MAG: hypothetical protein QG604_903 [Candidatus Dependentiae bacterium]|nr:hypothetical protein [Candidatus Dependentiae bacterium]
MKPAISPKSPHFPAFAEVVASTLTGYTAQCWSWDQTPAFGSLVCVSYKNLTLYGIVTNLETGSSDPQRMPFPYQKTEEELRQQHPQVFEFLRTVFTVSIAGYKTGEEQITHTLPPSPACIHAFVRPATDAEHTIFFSSPHFLAVLFGNNAANPLLDELLISILNRLIGDDLLNPTLFEHYYHTLTLLLGNDYRRLKILLQRIESTHASILEKQLAL